MVTGVMDQRVRNIYLIYLGLNETLDRLGSTTTDINDEYLWYKGNIIELHDIIKFLEDSHKK